MNELTTVAHERVHDSLKKPFHYYILYLKYKGYEIDEHYLKWIKDHKLAPSSNSKKN